MNDTEVLSYLINTKYNTILYNSYRIKKFHRIQISFIHNTLYVNMNLVSSDH